MLLMGSTIQVMKRDTQGKDVWGYPAVVEQHVPFSGMLLKAFFNRPDFPFHGIVLKEGDCFLELYFFNRWFNIFEIYDRDSGAVKCWYCNAAAPAVLNGSQLSYVDLALDYLVFPDGKRLLLDEEEFNDLDCSQTDKQKALAAIEEVKLLFQLPGTFRIREMLFA